MRGSDGREWHLIAFEERDGGPAVVLASENEEEAQSVLRWIQRIKASPRTAHYLPEREPVTVHVELGSLPLVPFLGGATSCGGSAANGAATARPERSATLAGMSGRFER